MKLTTIIIARNEERTIERAIESVSFSDEVIVLNDSSADDTKGKALKKGAIVIDHIVHNDFAQQRNFGLQKAKGDWILFLDADEEISHQLKEDIIRVTNEAEEMNYYLKRRDYFWGKELKFGELWSIRSSGIIRLVRRNAGNWSGKVHEEFQSSIPTAKLSGFINHYPHQSIKNFLQSINIYSTIRAQELRDERIRFSLFQLLFFPPVKFAYTYFVRLGFLDGPAGFVYSFMMSFHSFLVRAKLYQLEHV